MDRRNFLTRAIGTILGAIGAIVAGVLGTPILLSGSSSGRRNWVPAINVDELEDEAPTPVTVRAVRSEGYYQATAHSNFLLVKSGDSSVRALSATCTHLGCLVSWDAASQSIKCPCHGGVFDRDGRVTAGPPSGPLQEFKTRIEDGKVFVEI